MKLGMKVGLGPGHIVLDEDPAPPKGPHLPIFSSCLLWPNGWMDQDDIWYMEVDLGPGDTVLDGNSGPPKRGPAPPLFGPCYCAQTVAHLSYC